MNIEYTWRVEYWDDWGDIIDMYDYDSLDSVEFDHRSDLCPQLVLIRFKNDILDTKHYAYVIDDHLPTFFGIGVYPEEYVSYKVPKRFHNELEKWNNLKKR